MADIHPITLPKWGLEMSEGTIAAWRIEEGAAAAKGAELVDIETEKIVNTLDLERAGVLRRKLAAPGDTLPVGALIAVLAEPGVSDAEVERFIADFKPINASFEPSSETQAAAPAPPQAVASQKPAPQANLSADEIKARNAAAHASPIARRFADQLGIDLSTVKGTGKGERISQADVEAAAAALGKSGPAQPAESTPAAPGPAAPAPALASDPQAGPAARRMAREEGIELRDIAPTGAKGRIQKEDVRRVAEARRSQGGAPAEQTSELVPWTAMRRSIGQALSRAKQTVPHFYATIDIAMDDALALRARLNARGGVARVSVNDLVIKAAALALRAQPDVNVHVEEDGVRRFARADIALAVAIDGGLVTPVLRDAGGKDVTTIAEEAASLAKRARDRSLVADDLKGATFTISNLGMFGVRAFDAIVNPPQAAIIAVGATRREARETALGGVAFTSMMTATLSCDHRAIDGALAARFLAALRAALEDPLSLIL